MLPAFLDSLDSSGSNCNFTSFRGFLTEMQRQHFACHEQISKIPTQMTLHLQVEVLAKGRAEALSLSTIRSISGTYS